MKLKAMYSKGFERKRSYRVKEIAPCSVDLYMIVVITQGYRIKHETHKCHCLETLCKVTMLSIQSSMQVKVWHNISN